ncbi:MULTISPECIES: hypothetical protein [unclassified Microcoleus]|uniref:hypothetical protein n=1 Tax=unclassified Microcoleus TaxID=2642155 RepID=UPI002FD05F49
MGRRRSYLEKSQLWELEKLLSSGCYGLDRPSLPFPLRQERSPKTSSFIVVRASRPYMICGTGVSPVHHLRLKYSLTTKSAIAYSQRWE